MNLSAGKGSSFETKSKIESFHDQRLRAIWVRTTSHLKLYDETEECWKERKKKKNLKPEPIFLISLTVNRADSVELFATDTHCNIHRFWRATERYSPIIYYNLKHEQLRSTSTMTTKRRPFSCSISQRNFTWRRFFFSCCHHIALSSYTRFISIAQWFFAIRSRCVCLFFFRVHSDIAYIYFALLSCVKFKHVNVLHGMLLRK